MSVAQKYSSQVAGYQTPQEMATQNPQLYAQMMGELKQSSNPQDQEIYASIIRSGGQSAPSSGFVVHPEMKAAETRQQEAYAPAPTVAKSNAEQAQEAMIKQAQTSQQKNITQAALIQPKKTSEFESLSGDVTGLTQSDYWNRQPEGLTPLIQDPTKGVTITPEPGYRVTNPRLVVNEGQLAVAYEQEKITKQEDYGIGAQFLIGAELLSKVAPSLIERQFGKDTALTKIAKLEFETTGKFGLGFVAGGISAVESNVYGVAGLAGSVKKSVETGKLQYAPGFEGFDDKMKTPILAPSFVSASTGLILGSSEEVKAYEAIGKRSPDLFNIGYGTGNVLAEVGLASASSVGAGYVGGKIALFTKPVASKINVIAESTLARSKLVAQSGLNRLVPGLGGQVETVFSRDASMIAERIGKADVAFSQKAGAARLNLKYGLVEPAKAKFGLATENIIVKTGKAANKLVPAQAKEVSMYAKSVVSPNLAEYAKVPMSKTLTKISGSVKSTELYQGGRMMFTSESLLGKATKAKVIPNPLKNIKAEVSQVFKAEPIKGIPKTSLTKLPKSIKFTKGVTSTKNISVNDALKIATKRKGQLRGVAYEDTFKMNKQNMPSQIMKQMEKQTTVQLQKQAPLINKQGFRISGMPNLVGPYPGTTKQRYREDTELEYITFPKNGINLKPKPLTPETSITNSFSINIPKPDQVQPQPILPFPINIQRSDQPNPSIPSELPIPIIDQPQPIITIRFQPQPIEPDQWQPTPIIPDIVIPTVTNPTGGWPKTKIAFPSFPRGGGGGAGGGKSALRGKWRKQNNPIKSYDKLLKDIGGVKVSGSFKSSVANMDKALSRADKIGFNKKPKNKKPKARHKR